MTIPNLSALTLSELLQLQSRIGQEIIRRGVSRTSGSIEGEVGEALALAVYGGVLAPPGTKGYDLTDVQGRKIQVKTRTLPKGVHRIFQFDSALVDSIDFDLALCIRFDRETNVLDWAREYPREELLGLVSPHKEGPRLPTGRALQHGTDVTAKFRLAYEALSGTKG
ncbi:DUF6998 domain-containing protein [Pseudarthrobacter sp. NPDC058362]|uniref:DUF6998 domain-containing protein n=1 Tax=Pseudarthrobacter sp. NPDC058362 TaxID=3346458 RepID=UPI0036506ABC